MRVLLIIAVLVLNCMAQTTNHPHHTKEPNEYESVSFLYIPKTHHLLIRKYSGNHYSCYIAALTPSEIAHVHTDFGLRYVELHYLGQVNTATHVKPSALTDGDVRACHAPHNHTVTYYKL